MCAVIRGPRPGRGSLSIRWLQRLHLRLRPDGLGQNVHYDGRSGKCLFAYLGSKLTEVQGPLAPGFSKWPPFFEVGGPKGPQNFPTSYIYLHVRAPGLWFTPPSEKNRVSSPGIHYIFDYVPMSFLTIIIIVKSRKNHSGDILVNFKSCTVWIGTCGILL